VDPTAILHLIESSEFQHGLVAGLVAFVIGWLVRRYRVDWGLLWLPTVTVAGVWAQVLDRAPTERAVLLYGWVAPTGAIAVMLMSYGLIKNRDRVELAPALIVSLGGVWATVPDTEVILLVLGVTAVLIWLWWPNGLLPIRPVGAIAVAVVAMWAGTVGSIGRPGAYVGAFGALASLALLSFPSRATSAWWGFVIHVLLVVGWTRLAGLSHSASTAFALGAAVTAGILAVRYAFSPDPPGFSIDG